MWETEIKPDHMMITNLEAEIEKILKFLPQTLEGKERIIYGSKKHMEISNNCVTWWHVMSTWVEHWI